jgi:hypothetical protein
MLKKQSIFFTLLFLMSFAIILTGCLDYTQESQINRDGSGTMKLSYSLPPGSEQGRTLAQEFDTATIRTRLKDTAYTIVSLTRTMDSTDAFSVVIEISFNDIRLLNSAQLFNRFDLSFEDGAPGQKKFSQYIRPQSDKVNPRMQFLSKFIFEFDGQMITHNAHKVEGDKYIWEFKVQDIGDGKYIEATFAPQDTNYTPFIIAGVVAIFLIFAIGFFIVQKKIQKASA